MPSPGSFPLSHKGFPVPYITAWSAETADDRPLVAHQGRLQYHPSLPGDFDSHGVLWLHQRIAPGAGTPLFSTVHTPRQRRAMLRFLCQICGEPADRTAEGILWLLPGPITGAVEGEVTTHPPVCAGCAPIALAHCPSLRRNVTALRARRPEADHLYGTFYCLTPGGPVATRHAHTVREGYPQPWFRAAHIAVSLNGVTPVRLTRLR
ncbi:hypothetical protein [Streptomyces yaizuensis]|uniref:Uncharacterized protein n=1 Tax=Streptomyces yaizuensis TaxID=2989713 RepID=A0ABQ5PB09_9ACTN|nr:hypothetical protein [Streptomyces sp. YSPA8]GLF99774.1 hypothetical protein SYYSPA8_35775 [Streptomyces sp. YSPA8]